ncbi:MAG TPA: ribosome biogenesis GTP-binding protein YihA/YsxC [bacterium]
MKIVAAEFLQSAVSPRGFPPPYLPEVAFAGKSNVGKSSLINALLNRKRLVKTSSVPGKTQAINFFLINGGFRFVDLTGYGFAKVPLAVRSGWEGLISGYLHARPCLRGVVVILDARHDPGPLDRQLKAWLDEAQVEALYVANKVDKLKRAQVAARLHAMAEALELPAPPLACSAVAGTGRLELWRKLGEWVREPVRGARERSVS